MLIKLIPLILFPLWIMRLTTGKERALAAGIAFTAIVAGFAWFLPLHPFFNILVFVENIQGYGILFEGVSSVASTGNAKLILYSVGGGFMAYRVWPMSEGDQDLDLAGTELFFLLFVFSSMAFPWYLLLALPWLIVTKKTWLIPFVALSQINYYAHQLQEDAMLWTMLTAVSLGVGFVYYWRNAHDRLV